jgi:ubiquinone/menaquinone biosynthesis C-methylase UbiE
MSEHRGRQPIPAEILAHYGQGTEAGRLSRGIGPLEEARSRELIARYLPPPPAVVYDVGGGPGAYAFWLAGLGYEVHLVDATPLHIEQARARAGDSDAPAPASMEVGDARDLQRPDGVADALILHGPLYHLLERADRLAALAEARRVLRPGGLLLAFAITRYASTLRGLTSGWVWDEAYLEMCIHELETGEHRQPAGWPKLFTTAFFHHPRELEVELVDAGFLCREVLAVQGPVWMVPDFEENWQNEARRDVLLLLSRLMENEPAMSPHILAVGT